MDEPPPRLYKIIDVQQRVARLLEYIPKMSQKLWRHAEVRCLAGYRANERPISILLDESEIDILTVLESWREPDYLYFKVEAKDGRRFFLRHHEYEDFWQVREFPPRS